MRVREASDEPGSLNPRWPSDPIPRIWMSIPPASAMARSYAAQAAGMSSARVSGACTEDGRRSTCAASSASMTAR